MPKPQSIHFQYLLKSTQFAKPKPKKKKKGMRTHDVKIRRFHESPSKFQSLRSQKPNPRRAKISAVIHHPQTPAHTRSQRANAGAKVANAFAARKLGALARGQGGREGAGRGPRVGRNTRCAGVKRARKRRKPEARFVHAHVHVHILYVKRIPRRDSGSRTRDLRLPGQRARQRAA